MTTITSNRGAGELLEELRARLTPGKPWTYRNSWSPSERPGTFIGAVEGNGFRMYRVPTFRFPHLAGVIFYQRQFYGEVRKNESGSVIQGDFRLIRADRFRFAANLAIAPVVLGICGVLFPALGGLSPFGGFQIWDDWKGTLFIMLLWWLLQVADYYAECFSFRHEERAVLAWLHSLAGEAP